MNQIKLLMMVNIIAGVPISGVPPTASNEFTKILYLDTVPAAIELDTLVVCKQTIWRGLRAGELSFVNEKTPFPVKGYKEFTAYKSSPEFYMTPYINDFGHEFQISNTSAGVYILSKAGNLPIVPITGDPSLSLNLTFYVTAGETYSYSWFIINLGADTGKIQLSIVKHEAAANTASNAQFMLNLRANYQM